MPKNALEVGLSKGSAFHCSKIIMRDSLVSYLQQKSMIVLKKWKDHYYLVAFSVATTAVADWPKVIVAAVVAVAVEM